MASFETHSTILGPDGRPIQKQMLQGEIAEAQLVGVRNVWNQDSIADFLNPTRLADTLERARLGEHHDFLTLAEEMEERDLHYGSVLGTRKRALSGIEPEVEAASDKNQDVTIANDVRENIIDRPFFGDAVEDLLDALGKGYSAVEIDWETSTRQWRLQKLTWRDPRFFRLDEVNGRDLKLITDEVPLGVPLASYRWIIHRPRLKSGLPIRGALARLVAVAYLCKGVALSDWMTFAELFGMPVRVGKYGNNATPGEKATLRAAVASLGSDAAAIMPESMMVEFIETSKGQGGDTLYETLCNFLDKQVSKGVLGQTMTTDDGSSYSQAGVHNEVRKDILLADIRQLENAINAQLIEPFVAFNYGPQDKYPRVNFPVFEPEDTAALVDAVERLVPMGLRVEAKTMADKLGLPEPVEGAELLKPTKAASPLTESTKQTDVALNREGIVYGNDIDGDLEDWQEQLEPILNPLYQLAERSESEAEFLEGLAELLEQMDNTVLTEHLALSLFKAKVLGYESL